MAQRVASPIPSFICCSIWLAFISLQMHLAVVIARYMYVWTAPTIILCPYLCFSLTYTCIHLCHCLFLSTSCHWNNWTSSRVWVPEYFQSTSRIFPYCTRHFHIMELDKTMEIGFSNLFLQYLQNISILWNRPPPVSVAFWEIHAQQSTLSGGEGYGGGCVSTALSKIVAPVGRILHQASVCVCLCVCVCVCVCLWVVVGRPFFTFPCVVASLTSLLLSPTHPPLYLPLLMMPFCDSVTGFSFSPHERHSEGKWTWHLCEWLRVFLPSSITSFWSRAVCFQRIFNLGRKCVSSGI